MLTIHTILWYNSLAKKDCLGFGGFKEAFAAVEAKKIKTL